jgi:hypothetical protein
VQVTTDNLFNNSSVNITVTYVNVSGNATPANNADVPAGIANGGMWGDGTYIYYYNGTEIKRIALTTF